MGRRSRCEQHVSGAAAVAIYKLASILRHALIEHSPSLENHQQVS